jgi:hypothetical protein
MHTNSLRHLLILTCTVNPQVSKNLVRSHKELRLNDYITSLARLQKSSQKAEIDFLVAENSNSIDLIRSGLNYAGVDLDNFTFLSCEKDSLSAASGISAGEHIMLREVAISIDLSKYDVIWKLTGRLYIENLGVLISRSTGDFRANRFFTHNHTIDSRFFGMTTNVFKEFALNPPKYSEITERNASDHPSDIFRAIEFYLAHYALRLESKGLSVRGLPGIPLYRGISASTGKSLDGLSTRLKVKVLNRFRRFFIKGLLGVGP